MSNWRSVLVMGAVVVATSAWLLLSIDYARGYVNTKQQAERDRHTTRPLAANEMVVIGRDTIRCTDPPCRGIKINEAKGWVIKGNTFVGNAGHCVCADPFIDNWGNAHCPEEASDGE